MDTLERIKSCGIVPVIALDDAGAAVPLAKALLAGGIDVAEITFRTAAAEESIRLISEQVPEVLVGAGTVLTIDQAERAARAGAQFLVSPGLDVDLINKARELDVFMLPGAVTPTEIINGLKEGIELFKFFPAVNYGGLKTIKSLAAPFTQITFIPTGGVNADNLAEYLTYDRIASVGGSWICPKNFINEGKWEEIMDLAREAVSVRDRVRN